MGVPAFMVHFAGLPDPRVARSRVHVFWEILVIALLATLCGGQGWDDMQMWGSVQQQWLKERLGLQLLAGVPCADTFRRLLCRLERRAFAACLQAWTQALAERAVQGAGEGTGQRAEGEVLTLDGKALRGSLDSAFGQPALSVVRAWAGEARLVLGMEAYQTGEGDYEQAALRRLLGLLDIQGALVTADALHAQKETATQIIQQKADYLLRLKDNQPGVLDDAKSAFEYVEARPARAQEWAEERVGRALLHWTETDKGHGRVEVRRTSVLRLAPADPAWQDLQGEWAGLRAFVRVHRQRQNVLTGKVTEQTAYYISSSSKGAQPLGVAARQHWQVENCLHYVLDVTLAEDASRVRRDHGPANLAALRNIALNLHRRLPHAQGSMRARMKRAGWSPEYLLQLLG